MSVQPLPGQIEPIRGRWRLDPRRSSVEFQTKSLWGLATVKGHFDTFEGQLELGADPAARLTIDAASIRTGNAKRDRHLRSRDFFDVEQHPNVDFRADSIDLRGSTLAIRGRLSAKGCSTSLELDAEIRGSDGELEITGATTAMHRELGMTWGRRFGAVRPRTTLILNAHLVPA